MRLVQRAMSAAIGVMSFVSTVHADDMRRQTVDPDDFGIPGWLSTAPDDLIGGARLGYDWQSDNAWVYGLETEFRGSTRKNTGRFGANSSFDSPAGLSVITGTVTTKILWFGTARGRVGFLVAPDRLLYAIGNLAYGGIKLAGTVTDANIPVSWSLIPVSWTFDGATSAISWTVSGRIDGAAPNTSAWTWRVEYPYADFSGVGLGGEAPAASAFPTYDFNAHLSDDGAGTSFDYKFGSW
jgi:hypothetical protein